MNCFQVCLVLAASCLMLASAKPSSYKFGYSANDLGTIELDAPSVELVKDCDPLTSGYLATGSTPAPAMRTAVEIEPARIVSVTASPIHSEFVSVSTPAPLLRAAVDIEPARIAVAATPLKFETRIAASPLLSAYRPAIRSEYALATKHPLAESKIAMSVQHSSPVFTRILSAPSASSSYSYTAPQYYPTSAAYAPQYYSSSAFAPKYYSAEPKYYSSVSVAADEPCDK